MPRLNVVDPSQAEGRVGELFAGIQEKFGKVLNIFQGMGNSAAALDAYLSMADALAQGELTAADREVIYLAVSERNSCRYCVSAHVLVAGKVGLSAQQIEAIRRRNPIEGGHQALVRFVMRVIETQGLVDDVDLQAVRSAGYTDGQIAEAIGYIGLATFSNLFNHVFDTPLDLPPAPPL